MKAYPFLHKHPTSGETTISEGMDLRDWLAGIAMQGFIQYYATKGISMPPDNELAKMSYDLADAMMLQRKALSDE